MVLESWYGAFVPAGTPAAVVSRLNAEMSKALGDAATRDSLLQTATEPVGGSAETFAAVLRDDSAKYAQARRGTRHQAVALAADRRATLPAQSFPFRAGSSRVVCGSGSPSVCSRNNGAGEFSENTSGRN